MTTLATARRITALAARHADATLTGLGLPVMLITAAPSGQAPHVADLLLAGVTWLPLLARTRWPIPVAALVVVLDTVHIVLAGHATHDHSTLPAASMLALYTVGTRCTARITWTAGVTSAAIQYVTALITISDRLGDDLLYLNWSLLGALIGRLVRERQERIRAAESRAEEAEQTKASEARRQVTEERMRIARELHDVLAHHITIVNAQAGVALYLLKTDPDAAEKALAGIAENTRAALDELRATLGLLRSETPDDADQSLTEHAPTPDITQLPQLIDHYRAAGATISSRVVGTPYQLPSAADLGLYRITQEALTNASKHAPTAPIDIELSWAPDAVTLTVTNAVPAGTTQPGAGTGHGLLGMRERAAVADGTVTAAPTADGGFQVVASLPNPARGTLTRAAS